MTQDSLPDATPFSAQLQCRFRRISASMTALPTFHRQEQPSPQSAWDAPRETSARLLERDRNAAFALCILMVGALVGSFALLLTGIAVDGLPTHLWMIGAGIASTLGGAIVSKVLCEGYCDMRLRVAAPSACVSVAGVVMVAVGCWL